MKRIQPYYEILTPISDGGIEELKNIEKIGRTCYKSEDRISADGEAVSAKNFVAMLIRNGHEAMIEHSNLSVKFIIDRGLSHELVRHREASFAQESTRYVNYASKKHGNRIQIIDIKDGIKYDSKYNSLTSDQINNIYNIWWKAVFQAETNYLKLIENGASPQIARSVLPNSTKTELIITANYREWRHIFKLRTAKDAHPQSREIMIPLLNELKERIPVIFDDIEVEV